MVALSNYVEPHDAADIIGCTPGRVYQMVRAGDLKDIIQNPFAKKRYLIGRKECERIASQPATTGRPRKKLASQT